MKNNFFILLSLYIITFVSCNQQDTEQISIKPKKEIKTIFIIQRGKIDKKSVPAGLLKENKNFKNLISTFNETQYSVEQLKDKTHQSLKFIRPLTFKRKKSILDTSAIKSRFVLTEIHIKKLDYQLNKHKINKDSLEKTLGNIVLDINRIIHLIPIYKDNTDEFEAILKHDSINKNRENSKHPVIINTRNIKLNLKHKKLK